MEKIKDYAIILIYPDGEVEKIPITDDPIHILYFIDQLGKSERLRKIISDSVLKENHYGISKALVSNGVIEIANKDIRIKIENNKEYEQINPEFYFFYPAHLGSLEQLNALEDIEQAIPKDKIKCNEYYDAIFDFEKKLLFEYEIWKKENKKRLESEIHKL